jgi:hypothetical protein
LKQRRKHGKEGRKEKKYNRGIKEREMKNSKTEGKADETKGIK